MIGKLILFGIICLVVIGGAFVVKSAYLDTYQITGTVKDVKLVPNRDKGTTYVVWLTNGQKLEILRNPFVGENEDDLYQKISSNLNSTFVFTCWGWKLDWGWIYWYPNIAHAELLEAKSQ
jgi:hypothetical protein